MALALASDAPMPLPFMPLTPPLIHHFPLFQKLAFDAPIIF